MGNGCGGGGTVGGVHIGGVGEIGNGGWAWGWDATQLGWEGDNRWSYC